MISLEQTEEKEELRNKNKKNQVLEQKRKRKSWKIQQMEEGKYEINNGQEIWREIFHFTFIFPPISLLLHIFLFD